VAAVCLLLIVVCLFTQLLLVPLFGVVGVVAAWRARRNGAPLLPAIGLALLCAVPIVVVLIALAYLLVLSPLDLKVNGVSFQR
jgi:hypothetical protein